jgi:hypothetical protein
MGLKKYIYINRHYYIFAKVEFGVNAAKIKNKIGSLK